MRGASVAVPWRRTAHLCTRATQSRTATPDSACTSAESRAAQRGRRRRRSEYGPWYKSLRLRSAFVLHLFCEEYPAVAGSYDTDIVPYYWRTTAWPARKPVQRLQQSSTAVEAEQSEERKRMRKITAQRVRRRLAAGSARTALRCLTSAAPPAGLHRPAVAGCSRRRQRCAATIQTSVGHAGSRGLLCCHCSERGRASGGHGVRSCHSRHHEEARTHAYVSGQHRCLCRGVVVSWIMPTENPSADACVRRSRRARASPVHQPCIASAAVPAAAAAAAPAAP
jgi:hypothetical protein